MAEAVPFQSNGLASLLKPRRFFKQVMKLLMVEVLRTRTQIAAPHPEQKRAPAGKVCPQCPQATSVPG
jgi:hypothetical protein